MKQAPPRQVRQIVDAFQSDVAAIERRPEPLLARVTVYVLLAMVASFVVWASVSEVDRVVSARGAIETASGNIVVQPLETAIIKSIDVRHGDFVRAGQTLATLDPTFARADALQTENRIRALEAQIDRMEAEYAGRPLPVRSDRHAALYYDLQRSLYQERRQTHASRLKGYDEKFAQVQSAIQRRERDISLYEERLRVAREVEDMRRRLMAQETGSRLNYLISQNDRIEIERNLELARNGVIEDRHQLESVAAERESFIRGWESELLKELATVRSDRDALLEQLSKLQKRSELVVLETPVDAIVLDIAPLSAGSVVREAEAMFRLVPHNAALEVLAYIDAREIGTVKVGDPVEIKLDAFPFTEHGSLKGRVRIISGDAFSSQDAQPPTTAAAGPAQGARFYKARIAIEENRLVRVPESFRLIPGITLSAEIKVGERSILSYLLRPMLKAFGEAMREP